MSTLKTQKTYDFSYRPLPGLTEGCVTLIFSFLPEADVARAAGIPKPQIRKARRIVLEHFLWRSCRGSQSRAKIPKNALHTPGLANPRKKNRCYMNAVIQLLFGMNCTRDLFLDANFLHPANLRTNDQFLSYMESGGLIAVGLHHLFQQMKSGSPCLSVQEFKDSLVTNTKFTEYDNDNQHDAHLLLGAIMDSLSHTFDKYLSTNPINDLFLNKMPLEFECQICNDKFHNYSDENCVLPVGIENAYDISSCIQELCGQQEETFIECTQCNMKRKFTMTRRIIPAPILIIVLKRFNAIGEKVCNEVSTPDEIMVCASDESTRPYVLVSTVIHSGAHLLSGHYYTLMKKGSKWVKYDDEKVSELFIKEDNDLKESILRNAFLVVYCAKDKYDRLIGE